jgi:hypothetical protein
VPPGLVFQAAAAGQEIKLFALRFFCLHREGGDLIGS